MFLMTLGSLFDGIGAFPLAASKYGIAPIWASEIDKNCISITKRHFPQMKHLGDIAKIDGAKIEPVDIITWGSPCQGMSVSGKRKGLEDGRSGLFQEAVRIIREMQSATSGTKPRYGVWENVPGAFSSNNGEDFRTVIEAIVRIADDGVSIPKPAKWSSAGAVVGNGWSLAWRVLDAQYWGTAQRRRRIFLVADFGGTRAGEILFKPESGDGHIEPCIQQREDSSSCVGAGALEASQYAVDFGRTADRIQINPKVSVTLQGEGGGCGAKTGLYLLDNVVRRLTPLECERLQGFQDGWTEHGYDGRRITDGARYRTLGNSIAVPCLDFIFRRIKDVDRY